MLAGDQPPDGASRRPTRLTDSSISACFRLRLLLDTLLLLDDLSFFVAFLLLFVPSLLLFLRGAGSSSKLKERVLGMAQVASATAALALVL